MICRKDSLNYVEFIRGKYNENDDDYIKTLLQQMTKKEHIKILNNTFQEIWDEMWVTNRMKSKN